MTSWYFISLSFFVFTEYPLVICFGYYHCKLQKFICDIVIKFYFYHSINTSSNSDLLSRVYHTRQGKNTPICQSLPFFLRTQRSTQNAPYNKRQDTAVMVIPCLCFLRMALTYIVPVRYCINRGYANGAPAGGAFLVDIPEDWEPRAKQQPTGLIAYGTSCRRPVLVLHCPRKKSQVKRLGIFVVDGTGLEPVTSCTSSRCSTS